MIRTLALLPLVLACQAVPAAREPEAATPPFDPPALDAVVKAYDQAAGRRVDLSTMLDAAARNEVVFFGETHLDETTHRLELAVYRGLIERTGGRVVLAMEQFERDVQPVLDDYLAGRIDESAFLRKARPWGNYRTGYRPLIETAKAHGLPVVASNVPASLRRQIAFGGKEALDKLKPPARGWLAADLNPNSDAYWERVARAVRGHMGSMLENMTPEQKLLSSQSLWDNTMGESCARAVASHPGWVVMHVNGGFHSQYRDGTVRQLLLRRPETRVVVIEAVPVGDLPGVAAWYDKEGRADFLCAVDSRARGLQSGFLAVGVAPELRYRLSLPHGFATGARRVPLLIWLGDDGRRADDGLALWRAALGEKAAIAVVEPPFPQIEDDLALGGRWAWPETFSEDLGTLESGIEEICGYLMRHYPIDARHVVIAGRGSGATIAAAIALYSGSLTVPALASAPSRYAKLRTLPLPRRIPSGSGEGRLAGARRSLRVLAAGTAKDWWTQEAKDHAKAGLATEVVEAPADDWSLLLYTEAELRERLGLAPASEPEATAEKPGLLLVLDDATPRARDWAVRLARRVRAGGRAAALVPSAGVEGFLEGKKPGTWEVQPLRCLGEDANVPPVPEGFAARPPFGPERMGAGRGLPLAPGPFGGTTILVVPDGVTAEQAAAWKALEEKQVLRQRSRFARTRVVFEGHESDHLKAAFEETLQAHRSNVLVVPAVFGATPARMRRLRAAAEGYGDALTIAWQPGLGDGLAPLVTDGRERSG